MRHLLSIVSLNTMLLLLVLANRLLKAVTQNFARLTVLDLQSLLHCMTVIMHYIAFAGAPII